MNDLSLDETAARDPEPAKHWLTFLRNHREAIAARDFFTVATITFSALYRFFVISHHRRRILHFNVTKHPTSSWIVQQLREAFPFGSAQGSSSLIVMPSMDWKSRRRFDRWG